MRRILVGLVGLVAGLLLLASSPMAGIPEQDAPVQLLVALDTSDSLKADDTHQLLPQAATLMVHLLEEQDVLGLLRFDAAPSVLLEPGPLTPSHRQRALRELAHLGPCGPYTDIPAVLDAGLEVFGAAAARRRALVLITGGELDIDPRKGDVAAQVQRLKQTIIPAYKRADIALYTVVFAPKANQELLKELAATTGEGFSLAEKASDLHKALVRIYENHKQPQLAPLLQNRFCIDQGVAEAVLIATRENSEQPVELADPPWATAYPKASVPASPLAGNAGLGFELDPHQQQVSDQGGPDLDQHGILGGSVKGLNFQVLLDPLEKEFDLPAAAVEFGYLYGRQVQAVGQKGIFLAGLRVPIVHPA